MTINTTDRGEIDRLGQLLSSDMNGMDYVERLKTNEKNHLCLRLHLLTGNSIEPYVVTVTGGLLVSTLPVLTNRAEASDPVTLLIEVPATTDRSRYAVTISGPSIDPRFATAHVVLNGDDHETTPTLPSPAQQVPPFLIDYLATDFSSTCYPDWVERSEADFGVMFLEALAATADELSYQQDAIAAEATIVTANQPVSVLRHSRLVDYEPPPSISATTILQLDVTKAQCTDSAKGARFTAPGPKGDTIHFEPSQAPGDVAPLNPRWNRATTGEGMKAYCWDPSQPILDRGASVLWLEGQDHRLTHGLRLLLDTPAVQPGDPPCREVIHVLKAANDHDLLAKVALTRVHLLDPTTIAHDLTRTSVSGNIIDAVEGKRIVEEFIIPGGPDDRLHSFANPDPSPAAVRIGRDTARNGAVSYRYSLQNAPLSWIPNPGLAIGGGDPPFLPRIDLHSIPAHSPGWAQDGAPNWTDDVRLWTWERSLLDCGPLTTTFTLTPERYRPADPSRGLVRSPETSAVEWQEYDADGTSICFGSGPFGRAPLPGTRFRVTYWVTAESTGNVSVDTVHGIEDAGSSIVLACTNPFPATGGRVAASIEQNRRSAPQTQNSPSLLTLVSAADYDQAAKSATDVNHTRTEERWTGSWTTLITTVDPTDGSLRRARESVAQLVEGRKMSCRNTRIRGAGYLTLDIKILLDRLVGFSDQSVAAAVLRRLSPGQLDDGSTGFFDRSGWGFGEPLERKSLMEAVLSCDGVAGIRSLKYRLLTEPEFDDLPPQLPVPEPLILRIDADPRQPGRGVIRISTRTAP
jgi:hypothetical protein